jgi:hypothetical protein
VAGIGGKRAGSGRKLGSATRKTREVADKAMRDGGITPLEVLLEDMRGKYKEGDLQAAADRARDCAPYMHARLSSSNVAVRRITSISELADHELIAIAGEGGIGEEDEFPPALN